MTGMKELRVALTAVVKQNITDPRSRSDVQMDGYLHSQPSAPGFELEIDSEGVEYDGSMGRGHDDWYIVLRGFVGTGLDVPAQETLDEWMAPAGDNSVKAALLIDRTLGGIVDDVHVRRMSRQLRILSASAPNSFFLGAEWYLRIVVPGTT